jgi:hypothetical protein
VIIPERKLELSLEPPTPFNRRSSIKLLRGGSIKITTQVGEDAGENALLDLLFKVEKG